MVVNNELEWM